MCRYDRVPLWIVYNRNVTGTDLRVLIVIAAHANTNEIAWPSLGRIAAGACIDRSKVPGSVKRLMESGALRVRHRRDEAGGTAATEYEIVLQPPGDANDGDTNDNAKVAPPVETPVSENGITRAPAKSNTVLPLRTTCRPL